jgi:hypothetical protein
MDVLTCMDVYRTCLAGKIHTITIAEVGAMKGPQINVIDY